MMPGSPAFPDHPTARRAGYFLIGLLIGITGAGQCPGISQGQPASALSTALGSFLNARNSARWPSGLAATLLPIAQRSDIDVEDSRELWLAQMSHGADLFHGHSIDVKLSRRSTRHCPPIRRASPGASPRGFGLFVRSGCAYV